MSELQELFEWVESESFYIRKFLFTGIEEGIIMGWRWDFKFLKE